MKNSYFAFRQFTIHQERCAMKVGTDGTLLGAWAHGGQRILDVGTGTGLIALMMAQKNVDARVTGIDIDESAVEQARQNVAASPFANRVEIRHEDLAMTTGEYDAIVCNPPYFAQSLHCPDDSPPRHYTDLCTADEPCPPTAQRQRGAVGRGAFRLPAAHGKRSSIGGILQKPRM